LYINISVFRGFFQKNPKSLLAVRTRDVLQKNYEQQLKEFLAEVKA
jgi:hypothetical protein